MVCLKGIKLIISVFFILLLASCASIDTDGYPYNHMDYAQRSTQALNDPQFKKTDGPIHRDYADRSKVLPFG